MPISLTIATAFCTFILCAIAGRWIERRLGGPSPEGWTAQWWQLWALRLAGLWVLFWLVAPGALALQRPQTLQDTNAQQIMLGNQRLSTVEARIAAIESLRLDARLALVEEARDDIRTMRQWILGIVGGVVVLVIVQVLALLGKQTGSHRRP